MWEEAWLPLCIALIWWPRRLQEQEVLLARSYLFAGSRMRPLLSVAPFLVATQSMWWADRLGMGLLPTCALVAMSQRVLRLAAGVQAQRARMLPMVRLTPRCFVVKVPGVLVS